MGNIKYELRYKTTGFPWRVFDTYKAKDDPELIKHHKVYSSSEIIKDVQVIEVKTTRTIININK